MTIYHLIIYSLIPFIICVVLKALSYTPLQLELIENGGEEAQALLRASYSRYQKTLIYVGVFSFLFTVCHVTIAAAMLVKELM